VGPRVDFSANASIYDRRHGAILGSEIARQIASASGLEPGRSILDVGAGTGRVALAFAAIGYRMIALDPALPMLSKLRRKASVPVLAVAGEGARLPFAAGQFDGAVVARTSYLIADWRQMLREVSTALKPDGPILHEWANGQADEPWVQVREELRRLFQNAGVAVPFHPGARTEADVDSFLAQLGLVRSAEVTTGPGSEMTLREFIGRIESGEFSYTWNVPDEVKQPSLSILRRWCGDRFDLERAQPVPRELRWTIYKKS